jgi:hypothetical protein
MWQYDRSVFTLSYPNLTRGGGESWPGGTMSPYLNWVDWAPTQTRIVVHPFGPMDSEITVEWWTETDTWVDFNYTGLPENGGFATPYKTMGKAVTNAPLGGIVKFKPGSKNETGIIDKRLMFEAPLGTVTIGQ